MSANAAGDGGCGRTEDKVLAGRQNEPAGRWQHHWRGCYIQNKRPINANAPSLRPRLGAVLACGREIGSGGRRDITTKDPSGAVPSAIPKAPTR
jgi:hypothetical protein